MSRITCPSTASARRRLARYRRWFDEDSLLLVPYEVLTEVEQERGRALASIYGEDLARDAFEEFARGGMTAMRPAGLFRYVIGPLCFGDPLEAMATSYLHPYDEAYWRLALSEPSLVDPRAQAFAEAFTEAAAARTRKAAKAAAR